MGLVGIAALAAGLKVTFSDAVPLAVEVATENAVRNGLQPDDGLVLDWHEPPSDSYPLIFASDVLYDRDLHGPLLNTLDCVLAPDGECWIGEPGRSVADEFVTTLKQRGFSVDRYQLPRPPSARKSVIFRVVPPDLQT